ncbi:MAG: protein-disulfide reductase DsbD [Calditrichaeota bacterium]|nr:protein-disulfide reductase DsbD [Calditrichota bacterium]
MRKIVVSLLLLLLYTSTILSQNEQQIIHASFVSPVSKFTAGDSYPLAVKIDISNSYHINADKPGEDYLIPTTLTLQSSEEIAFGKIDYPKAKVKKFEFSEKPLAVYENTIYIFTTISIPPDINTAEIPLKGIISYQACDDQTCMAPEEFVFSDSLLITGAGETVSLINQDIFSERPGQYSAEEVTARSDDGNIAQTISEKGWLLTFVLVFLGGLALNLTPCVYPLIPITISYFGGQTDGRKGGLFFHALIYVFGMAITYSLLGVIAAMTGSLFGAALQNPYVLLIIAAILTGLALSMFDLYEIRVPAFLSNFAGGARKGYSGSFFMGLTVGIVAAPCIGPFVLALLTYVGEKGDPLLGFWLFFVLAIGLGIPFIFLGVFSGSLAKIPRSGAWMVWVRNIFGFILIAMAIYFLQPLFPNNLIYYITLAIVMLVGGIYMAWIESTKVTGRVFPVIRNLIGVLFFIISIVFLSTGIQGFIEKKLEFSAAGQGAAAKSDQINWKMYSEKMLETAAADNKPVMLDFYADWCIPCKELDKFTFSQPEIIEISRDFIMMKVDLTKAGEERTRNLRKRYEIKGVPTLVFLTPEGEELREMRVVGFLKSDELLPLMEQARERAINN